MAWWTKDDDFFVGGFCDENDWVFKLDGVNDKNGWIRMGCEGINRYGMVVIFCDGRGQILSAKESEKIAKRFH